MNKVYDAIAHQALWRRNGTIACILSLLLMGPMPLAAQDVLPPGNVPTDAGVAPANAPATASRPNVLLIAVDDLNDWVGFLAGHPQAKTPHMDRLARRGMVFANAHCAAPLCNPSRAAIFTGQQPFRTGIYNNDQNIRRLRSDRLMLPQAFAAAGYRTLGTGKLLHSGGEDLFDDYFHPEQRWSPFGSKREVQYPAKDLARKPSQPRYTVLLNGQPVQLPLNGMPSDRNPAGAGGESFDWGPLSVTDQQMGDGQITTWAIEQLQQMSGSEQAFLLAVGYYRPHIPLWAPQKYFDLYPESSIVLPPVLEGDLEDLSETGRRWATEAVTAGSHRTVVQQQQWQAAVAAYLACVSFVDAQIGRLLDALDGSAYAENTVIVLFGDHGWHLGEKQHWGKWTGWQRATRVPLLIVPPRRDAARYQTGTSCHQPVGLVDLYPTLQQLCGLPADDALDGESLVASLQDPARQTEPELSTFDYQNYSVGDDRWRLIRYRDGSEELYDHRSDPHEWHNLAADQRYDAVRQRLRSRLPASPAPPIDQAPTGANKPPR